MKVMSVLTRMFPKDVKNTFSSISGAVKTGNVIGRRCARINNKKLPAGLVYRQKAIVRNMKFKKDDIPALSAAISSVALFPVPGSTFIGYGLGKVIKSGISIFNKGAK